MKIPVVVFLLLLAGMFAYEADAEVFYIYVQKMPVHWQDKFGDVLDKATQYWEERRPDVKFYPARFVDDADFVLEWASQYEGGKLGYYSKHTINEYGKPKTTIALGYFKDKKWNLVSPEYALEITKHELGHAIGLPHSTDPNDIMYPTLESYELWQQSKNPTKPAKTTITSKVTINPTDWKSKSLEYKKLADSKIKILQAKVLKAERTLNSTWYEDSQKQFLVDKSWTALWWAKKYLGDAEYTQKEGKILLAQSKFEDAFYKYRFSYESVQKAEPKLSEITRNLR